MSKQAEYVIVSFHRSWETAKYYKYSTADLSRKDHHNCAAMEMAETDMYDL